MDPTLPDHDHPMLEVDEPNDIRAANTTREFEDLPLDIIHLIVEQVVQPTDLRNVCLVSKQLHSVAVRYLYHEIYLELGVAVDGRIISFASPNNIGLRHLRRLHFAVSDELSGTGDERYTNFAIRMIIEVLPKDTLEEVIWNFGYSITAENMLLMYRRQRKMKRLEIAQLDRDILSDLQQEPYTINQLFRHTKGLTLLLYDGDAERLSAHFITMLQSQLEQLSIWGDTSTDYTTTLFPCKMPFNRCTPFAHLRKLELKGVPLHSCVDTWCHFIDFRQISTLALEECTHSDELLRQMCSRRHLPRCLERLNIKFSEAVENRLLTVLNEFLRLVSGLRRLTIDLVYDDELPNAQGILKHGETLEVLSVHGLERTSHWETGLPYPEFYYDSDTFQKICLGCPKLEQLSCAWPPTDSTLVSEDWRAYESDPPEDLTLVNEDWRKYESGLAHLRALVTLRIANWPVDSTTSNQPSRLKYRDLLQARAKAMFDEMRNPSVDIPAFLSSQPARLRLIAFGSNNKILERQDSKYQFIFLKSMFTDDTSGQDRIEASPISWGLRRYIEPRSDVLDLVMLRQSHEYPPPCGE